MANIESDPSFREGRPVIVFQNVVDCICSLIDIDDGPTLAQKKKKRTLQRTVLTSEIGPVPRESISSKDSNSSASSLELLLAKSRTKIPESSKWIQCYKTALVKTAFIPDTLQGDEQIINALKKLDIEPTQDEDLDSLCCLRFIDTALPESYAEWKEWNRSQYLVFIGPTMPPNIYGIHFASKWNTPNPPEDGIGIPTGSAAIVYAEGTVEAMGGTLIRITNKKKAEIPKYDSLRHLKLHPGCGPLRLVARWMYGAHGGRKSMAFTGAGISAESGVPTYRDVGGLWTTFNPMEVSSIKGLARDPRKVWKFEEMFFSLLRKVTWNPGHKAMADLESEGYMKGIVTQNVDGLHQLSGSKEVVEIHGSEVNAICLSCKERTPMTTVMDELLDVTTPENKVSSDPARYHVDDAKNAKAKSQMMAYATKCRSKPSKSSSDSSTVSSSDSSSSVSSSGIDEPSKPIKNAPRIASVPLCPKCQGFLKTDGIYFGEPLQKGILKKCVSMAISSEVVLMCGTSGKVNPARQLPIIATREPNPSKVIEINPNTTLLSAHAHIRLIGSSATTLPKIMEEIKHLESVDGKPKTVPPVVVVPKTNSLETSSIETKSLEGKENKKDKLSTGTSTPTEEGNTGTTASPEATDV